MTAYQTPPASESGTKVRTGPIPTRPAKGATMKRTAGRRRHRKIPGSPKRTYSRSTNETVSGGRSRRPIRLWAIRGPKRRATAQGTSAPREFPTVAAAQRETTSTGPSRTRRAATIITPMSEGTNGKAFSRAVKRATAR
ncbi:MAG TPA: hypothetical protein VG712_03915 [Gemmatimonadales bacterium]|nr:hypothetical protein [Gemmatimonadales bacterium]